jgi:bifunctional non-homologous end joining protein LigD
VFRQACKLGLEGIVSKRLGSPYRSGRSQNWIKSKNPAAPAVKREAEEGWGSTTRVGFSQCSKHRHYRIALEFGAMRARIAYERLNELQRRRLLRRTIVHNKETHHIASLPYYGWSQSDAREQTRIREPLR